MSRNFLKFLFKILLVLVTNVRSLPVKSTFNVENEELMQPSSKTEISLKSQDIRLEYDNFNLNDVTLRSNETYAYYHSGNLHFKFKVPSNGRYKLEVDAYGSSGVGYFHFKKYSNGGHVKCILEAVADQFYYVYFGGGGSMNFYRTYNGVNTLYYENLGGVAVDLRTKSFLQPSDPNYYCCGSPFGYDSCCQPSISDETDSLDSRLVVGGAGGGSGDGYFGVKGGDGGGFVGGNGIGGEISATGGSQTQGGKNGICPISKLAGKGVGGNGCNTFGSNLGAGGAGGGGYYGGGGGAGYGSGGGGSSYCDQYANMIINDQGVNSPTYGSALMTINLIEIPPTQIIQTNESLIFSSGRNITFQIPDIGHYQLIIEAYGSKGADSKFGGEGGNGGYIQCILDTILGQIYYVDVGDTLQNGGGGTGYMSDQSLVLGNGGGATSLRTNITDIIGSRVVVAAGGGGGGYTFAGGDGGGNIGADGSVGVGAVATGGTQIKGGQGGYHGKLGLGGNGFNSGGGGGGYYGGGAGTFHGGGAGGSNYCNTENATIITNKQGVNDREGYMIVTLIDVTVKPTSVPTVKPSVQPSIHPTYIPTPLPSIKPSSIPSPYPTTIPTFNPSSYPTTIPSQNPTAIPSVLPSSFPTIKPTHTPTVSTFPHTKLPTTQPASITPTISPTQHPNTPSTSPSMFITPTTIEPTLSLLINTASNRSNNNNITQITIGTTVAGGLCLLFILSALFLYSRRKHDDNGIDDDGNDHSMNMTSVKSTFVDITDIYNDNSGFAPSSRNNMDNSDSHGVYAPLDSSSSSNSILRHE